MSLRDVEAITGIPKSTVQRLLHSGKPLLNSIAYQYGYRYRITSEQYVEGYADQRRSIEAVKDDNVRAEELEARA